MPHPTLAPAAFIPASTPASRRKDTRMPAAEAANPLRIWPRSAVLP